eukprot:scaffold22718_cov135-Cylindrotheca_fusiformis.AAC.1
MVARWTDGIQEGSAPGAIRHNPGEESRSNDGHVEEANNKGRSIERSKRARVHWKTEKLSDGKRKIGAGKKAKSRNSVRLAMLRDHCFDDARRMSSGCCSTSCTASGAPPPSLSLLCSDPVRARTASVASRLRRLAWWSTTPN